MPLTFSLSISDHFKNIKHPRDITIKGEDDTWWPGKKYGAGSLFQERIFWSYNESLFGKTKCIANKCTAKYHQDYRF